MRDSLSRLFYSLAGSYADAHRDNEKRFIISADEKLIAFLELERITRDDSD